MFFVQIFLFLTFLKKKCWKKEEREVIGHWGWRITELIYILNWYDIYGTKSPPNKWMVFGGIYFKTISIN